MEAMSLVWGIAGCFVLMAVLWFFHDRYVLPLVAMVVALRLSTRPLVRPKLAVLGLCRLRRSVCSNLENLHYKRALWNAVSWAEHAESSEELDGGYVVNGAVAVRAPGTRTSDTDRGRGVPWINEGAMTRSYAILNGVSPGVRILHTERYRRLLAPPGTLYLVDHAPTRALSLHNRFACPTHSARWARRATSDCGRTQPCGALARPTPVPRAQLHPPRRPPQRAIGTASPRLSLAGRTSRGAHRPRRSDPLSAMLSQPSVVVQPPERRRPHHDKARSQSAAAASSSRSASLVVSGAPPIPSSALQEWRPAVSGHGVRQCPLILVDQDEGLAQRHMGGDRPDDRLEGGGEGQLRPCLLEKLDPIGRAPRGRRTWYVVASGSAASHPIPRPARSGSGVQAQSEGCRPGAGTSGHHVTAPSEQVTNAPRVKKRRVRLVQQTGRIDNGTLPPTAPAARCRGRCSGSRR
mgnify:CR=1 FL=1